MQLDRANPENFNVLGNIEIAAGNFDAAREAFEQARQLDPINANAMVGLADVYYAEGDREQAEEFIRAAAALAPTDLDVLARLRQINRGR